MTFATYARSTLLGMAFILGAGAAYAAPVNINSADAQTIAKSLKGIGIVKAQAIVSYREKHGGFKSPDELQKVKGIGASLVERNRMDIRMRAETKE
ncbi:MAG: ComEA family DNA-binding protein [Acidihalobacter sp.]|uniref:ComEA family DNA-binding protein n=1 Tax=Acidihalobacter sp. TaxID=1872108 RepID=UPI00307F7550